MNKDILTSLHCPFCKEPLKIKRIYYEERNVVKNAAVACACSTYPIISGVLFISKDQNTKKGLKFIKSQPRLASKYPEIPFFLLRLPEKLLFIIPIIVRFNIFKDLKFNEFVKLLTLLHFINKDWCEYLLRRYSRPDFLGARKALGYVKKGFRVLDAGCGAGHLLSILSKKVESKNLIGIDKSILNIYLAAKYKGKSSNLIYMNMEYPLPFPKNFFDMTFSNDTIAYIANKKRLAKEINRTLKSKGLVALTNLNNRKFVAAFKTPPPHAETFEAYTRLFPPYKAQTLTGNPQTKSFSILYRKY